MHNQRRELSFGQEGIAMNLDGFDWEILNLRGWLDRRGLSLRCRAPHPAAQTQKQRKGNALD